MESGNGDLTVDVGAKAVLNILDKSFTSDHRVSEYTCTLE
jgi:hypothetical protein